jgi:hypothetical protein
MPPGKKKRTVLPDGSQKVENLITLVQVGGEPLKQMALWDSSDDLFDNLASLKNHECRDASNSILHGSPGIGIDIHFSHFKLAIIF